jgi:hypothetical protein
MSRPENADAPLRQQRGVDDIADQGGELHVQDSMRPRPFMHRFRSGVLQADAPSSLKLVLLVLAEYADAEGGSCYPSATAVARLAGLNERTVRRLLDQPCAWLQRIGQAGSGHHWRTYGYRLLIPEAADTTPARWTNRLRDGADTTPAAIPEAADTVPATPAATCGHSVQDVRTLSAEGAGVVSDEIGFKIGKSRLAKSARTKQVQMTLTLPTWLPADAWATWKQHRKAVGRKFTEHAEELALRRLTTLRTEGHDPVKLIELAIESGWSSFNPRESTKASGNGAGQIQRDTRTEDEIGAANRAQLARFGIAAPA